MSNDSKVKVAFGEASGKGLLDAGVVVYREEVTVEGWMKMVMPEDELVDKWMKDLSGMEGELEEGVDRILDDVTALAKGMNRKVRVGSTKGKGRIWWKDGSLMLHVDGSVMWTGELEDDETEMMVKEIEGRPDIRKGQVTVGR